MLRRLHITLGRSRFSAWVLLASVLFAQLGVGPGLLAVLTSAADACCNRTCPCQEVADAGDVAHHDHNEDACPANSFEPQCPLGCDDCTCCPGAMVALAPSLTPCLEFSPGGVLLDAPPDDPAAGVPGRIFRPPDPSLV